MNTSFAQHPNFLSQSILEHLQKNYMRDDIQWTHRGFGRFFSYLTEEEHNMVLEDVYESDPGNPLFKDKWLMRSHHMYMQRFIPESWLPMHRERCYGVITIYMNPDSDWKDEPQPKFVYYTTNDLTDLDNNEVKLPIPCNTGTYMITHDRGLPEFSPYHKVEYNKSNVDRFCLQIFYGPSGLLSGPAYKNTTQKFEDYAEREINYTGRALQQGTLEVPGFQSMADVRSQFNEDHADIIDKLENGWANAKNT